MSQKHPSSVKVQIELDPETAQGTYVNLAMVNHNETEFVVDAVYVQPQEPKGKLRARLIMNPKHAKRLLTALGESVQNYERRFGSIQTPPAVPTLPPDGALN